MRRNTSGNKTKRKGKKRLNSGRDKSSSVGDSSRGLKSRREVQKPSGEGKKSKTESMIIDHGGSACSDSISHLLEP